MGYFYLFLTVILESASIIFTKLSNGFEKKQYFIGAVTTYILSFVFFTLALKYLPVGWANAVWAGTSAITVAIAGYFIFGEKISFTQVACLVLIIIGLAGLHLTDQK